MIWLLVAIILVPLVALPAAMFAVNVRLFMLGSSDISGLDGSEQGKAVSVLVPARDEAAGIEACVQAALASRNVEVEVVVMDDGSTDGTDQIVQRLASQDDRVVYCQGKALPDGWNGKQFACWQLSQAARHDRMAFIDADVRLQPDALEILSRRMDRTGVALLSMFPHQETGTFWEKLLIPMMHYVLLGYLPMARMRASDSPGFAAGCGQFFLTDRDAYRTAGTHEAIRGSRHDGVKLPRAYRTAGLMTDVVDGTHLARCRMYHNAAEVFRGVLKNATEGIASPRLIVPFSILLIGASVAPTFLLVAYAWGWAWGWASGNTDPILPAVDMAIGAMIVGLFVMSIYPRAMAAIVFRQSWTGVILHPIAVLVFILLQWIAWMQSLLGIQVAWRGRVEKP
ncbi:glycosyltransferase family 2 protein [Crateriforma conspicua]|uniref:glycosyltransferase family 2 protein n=1 Tax=Crateriforma conspicua TaxID=2527996 RepID=UPI001188B472|nr:glycosyltransferase family 2 protein [Crateriforma conspicua]QDV63159.1 4,4'-diaponeurosporenoate glycosyltransferase [Crateriforma conspicua]